MKRITVGLALASIALVVGAGAAAAVPGPIIDPAPIGPNQAFTGLVNGRAVRSSISVVGCPNPASASAAAGQGHPLGGQSVEVLPLVATAALSGFTGNAHKISVDLEIPAADPMLPLSRVVHLGQLSSYVVRLPLAPTLSLPCRGTATAVFNPVNGGNRARDNEVQVTFVTPKIVPVTASTSPRLRPGTVIGLAGTGFAPDSTYQVAECSQTHWIAPQSPCVAGNAVDVTTDANGSFSSRFTVELCLSPAASVVETCYLGVPAPSGVDTVELVAAAKVTVVPRVPSAH